MDAKTFLDHFAAVADAPGGVDRLRRLVLDLAVHGRLVPQDPNDQPVPSEQLAAGRKGLLALGKIGKPRYPEGRPVEKLPYSIPATWRWYHLGDVGAVVGGGTPSSQDSRFWADDNAVPWITPADMRGQTSRYVTRGERDITEEGLTSSSAQLLPARSVLFSSRAPIGHVGIAKTPLATNQGFKSCVPYMPDMSEYLYVFLKKIGPEVSDAATGTTFKEVSGKQVALIPVPVPPTAEQRRIVSKVDELMQLCDDLEASQRTSHHITTRLRVSSLDALTNAETEDDLHTAWSRLHTNWGVLTDHPNGVGALRQAILQLAVRGRLVRQDPVDEPVTALLERCAERKQVLIVSGQLRRRGELPPLIHTDFNSTLPTGWTLERLERIAGLAGGVAKGRKLGAQRTVVVPYLRVANVKAGELLLDEVKEIALPIEELSKYQLEEGDVLLTEGGDWDKLGRSAIWLGEIPICVHQNHIFRARPLDPGIESGWISLFTNSPIGREYFQSKAKRTTNLASINMSELRSTPIPLPPAAEQVRILDRVTELMALCNQLQADLGRRDSSAISLADVLSKTIAA